MNFPANLRYTAEHEWIRVDGDEAYVGISEFAQGELGDIVFVDINSVGQAIAKDGIFGSVEAVKTVSDLFLPLGGDIIEKNEGLDNDPQHVNEDPYGKGWMIKIKMSNPSEVDGLLSSEDYSAIAG